MHICRDIDVQHEKVILFAQIVGQIYETCWACLWHAIVDDNQIVIKCIRTAMQIISLFHSTASGPCSQKKRNSCKNLSLCGSSKVNSSITTYFHPNRIFPVEECTTTCTAKWMQRWPRLISAKVCVLNAFSIGIIEVLCVIIATHNWLECAFFIINSTSGESQSLQTIYCVFRF